MSELRKFIDHEINYCISQNMQKKETRQHIFDFLNKYNIDYVLLDNNNDKFQIDNLGWEIHYNNKGICRGFNGYEFE